MKVFGNIFELFSSQSSQPADSATSETMPVISTILNKPEEAAFSNDLVGRVQKKDLLNINKYKAPAECEFPIHGEMDTGRVFLTKNDGSCGLHSLFGEYNSKEATFIMENVRQKREEIADWVENSFENGNPSPLILESLRSYIDNPDDAPSYVKSMLTYIRTSEVSDRIEDILNRPGMDLHNKSLTVENPLLRAAFIRHLREVSSFLSLEEIGAIAIHYNKKITFYTKFDNELVKTISHGSDQNPEICMSFDHEKRHFSKMLKKTLGQELKETPAHFQVQIKTDEEREQEDFALACQFASEFNLENSGPQNILKTDHEAAESLQRAFDEEEKNKKAQEEADVAYARFLEAESNVDSLPIDVSLEAQESNFSLKREDFYDFYDWSIRNKQPYFFHLAILHYSCSLRRGEEIPLNLKNVLIKSPEYQKSLTFAVNEYGLIPKFIFQSREWKEAYLQHLMSGRSLSKEDLHVIEQLNKRKNIQKFFDNNNINNRRSLNLALIGWIQRFKKKEKIPLNLNEALKKLESQGLINYRKKILQSNEWKEAYTKHLMKEYDLSENDLSVLDEVSS